MDVLLVDDQDCVREVLAELLEDAGLNVTSASSGEEALCCMSRSGPPNVLVTDLDLGPGVSGLALADDVAGRWPQVGVVFITGRPWLLQERDLHARQRFVQKPCPASKLIGAVEELRPDERISA